MYLRTARRKNRDGSEVVYYQLAHNARHPNTGQTVAQVIHTFGRADELDREALVRLCRSIARVCGLKVEDPLGEPPEVAKGGRDATPVMSALPEGMTLVGSRRLGLLWLVEALWERLGVGPTLRQVLTPAQDAPRFERALLAMTANRLCDPQSKLGVWERWRQTVYLPGAEGLTKNDLYAAMDALHAQAVQVEEAVFFRTADLFKLEVDLLFYDTTTCTFAIDEDDEEDMRCFGRPPFDTSGDGAWAPQVVVALAVTREGLPVRSWVFPGNTTDVTTVERIKDDLRGWKLGRALFVADAGMHSEANREVLARGVGKYVLAVPMGAMAEVKTEVLSRPGRYRKIEENLLAKEVVVGDGERRRRYIVCFNPKEADRQAQHRAEVLQMLQEELARHPTRSATAKWAMELLTSGRYRRHLKVKGGDVCLDAEAVRQAPRLDGKWVLITNDDTLSVEEAAVAYKSLLVIERCFRSLKRGQIQLGPMYHRLPPRIEAHVKICVLALLIQRVVEHTTGESWFPLRHRLNALQATEFRTATHQFFHRNEPTPELKRLFKTLEISMPNSVLAVHPLPPEL